MDFLLDLFGGPMGFNLMKGGLGGMGGMGGPDLPTGPGGAPSLLKAGTDDMQPQGLLAPGAGMLRAGLDPGGPRGGGLIDSNPADAPAPGSAEASLALPTRSGFPLPGGGGGGDALVGGAGGDSLAGKGFPQPPAPGAPAGVITPRPSTIQRDPDATKPFPEVKLPTIPNAGGGPDERGPAVPRPIVPPKLDTTLPTSSGKPIISGGAAPAPAATPPAGGPAKPEPEPNKTTLQKFLEEMGKAKPAGGQQGGLKPASMSYGQPHIPQGAASLFEKLMADSAARIPKVKLPTYEPAQRY
jgi:hypothetical protein